MKHIKLKSLIALFAIVSTSFFACNNDQKGTNTSETTDSNQGKIEITLNASDEMKYDKNEITVSAGQTVVLTLNHTGKMPVATMGHNFVLLNQGTDIGEFALIAMDAKDNNYLPSDGSSVIAHTKILGGGESDTITFTAPEKGTYDFICSFPGHWGAMKGKFIVQ